MLSALYILMLVIAGLIRIWCHCFYCSSAGKNRSESDSNDIVSLCIYCYSCGVLTFLTIMQSL